MALPDMIYVTDPMCSWCWGFAPVIGEVRLTFKERTTFHMLVGGLRPGNTERFDEQRREYILGHWQEVHKRTGQPFDFSFRMGPDFTYDTEPAARAVVAVRLLEPDKEFRFFQEVQRAFYVNNADVTKEGVLSEVAASCDMDQGNFLSAFRDMATKRKVLEEFDYCRTLGGQGFPTLLGQEESGYRMLTHGYQPFATLSPKVEAWLEKKGLS